MNRITTVLLGAAIVFTTAAWVPLHEVTYMGTVRALGDASIEVMVIDEGSGSETPMTFRVTAETKVYRGDNIVAIAEAGIEVEERIAITVNVDVPGNSALVVRLGAPQHH